MRRSRQLIRQILPVGTPWARFVQWVNETRDLRASSCVAEMTGHHLMTGHQPVTGHHLMTGHQLVTGHQLGQVIR